MIYGDFALCCSKEGSVIAYTRSLEEVTWLIIHNFLEEEQSFEYEKMQSSEQVILFNYDEVNMENGQVKLRAYETLIARIE